MLKEFFSLTEVSGNFKMTNKVTYFGDKNTFAIRYVPGKSAKDKIHHTAYCHLVLGGQIIGNIDEFCLLDKWLNSLKRIIDQIKNDLSSITHEEFYSKNNNEIIELILKANQHKEEFKPEYAYLPLLEKKVWSNCIISMDETTDAYLITMTEQEGKIKFLWLDWREPCSNDQIGVLYSTTVDGKFVVETMENCLNKIVSEFLEYPPFE